MIDEQFQVIEKLEDIRTKMVKLEEKELEGYLYREAELLDFLRSLYSERIHLSRSRRDVCYMLDVFFSETQYFEKVLDEETKRYDNEYDNILQIIETYKSNGDFSAAKSIYDNELSELLKQKKAMIERIKADIENSIEPSYNSIITAIFEIDEQLEKNAFEISQIKKQLEEIQERRSNDSYEIDDLKRNDTELSSSILNDAERILEELKSRVS